jgi:hypothetical protein
MSIEIYSEIRNPQSEMVHYATRSLQTKNKLPSDLGDRPLQPAMLLLHAGARHPPHLP